MGGGARRRERGEGSGSAALEGFAERIAKQ